MTRVLSFSIISLLILGGCNSGSKLINGVPAPEIEMPKANGDLLKLSSLKGKIVLVEFWASWCKPCRKNNPNLVRIYNQYKNADFTEASGFDIYSVSLDSKKDKWLKAIKDDQLTWDHHVSELSAWKSSAAESYNVSSIPSSFLLDQNGIIIGKDLRHQDLAKILSTRSGN